MNYKKAFCHRHQRTKYDLTLDSSID